MILPFLNKTVYRVIDSSHLGYLIEVKRKNKPILLLRSNSTIVAVIGVAGDMGAVNCIKIT